MNILGSKVMLQNFAHVFFQQTGFEKLFKTPKEEKDHLATSNQHVTSRAQVPAKNFLGKFLTTLASMETMRQMINILPKTYQLALLDTYPASFWGASRKGRPFHSQTDFVEANCGSQK